MTFFQEKNDHKIWNIFSFYTVLSIFLIVEFDYMSSDSSSDLGCESDLDEVEKHSEAAIVNATFQQLGVKPALCSAIDTIGWKNPTEIQKGAIVECLNGRDIIGLAGKAKILLFTKILLVKCI